MDSAWPSGVPLSLWTYAQLRADELVSVPMMGVKFAPSFLYAFAFGCFFVAFFAWGRFSKASQAKSTTAVLDQVSAADLGGNAALVRAYFIYAGAILILYVSLTFFGKLILQSAQMIPVAGIQVGTADLRFDSPQWPLMLAFAFAGLAPMLKPVETVENWLRNRAYRAVGIPVRLEQTMRSLIATLEHASALCARNPQKFSNELKPLCDRLWQYRTDWESSVQASPSRDLHFNNHRQARRDNLLSLLSQLELLVFWARTARGGWPGHEVSHTVRELERNSVDQAEMLMNDFRKLLQKPLPNGNDAEKAQHLARFDESLNTLMAEVTKARDDMVGILAIFLERDMDSPDTMRHKAQPVGPNRSLVALLKNTERPDTPGSGPETGLFFVLIGVFLIYATATWRELQIPVGQYLKSSDILGMVLTAVVETLRIASLTWLPLLAAFSLRQYLWDRGDWARARKSQRPTSYGLQILYCTCLALIVSLLGLAGVATLRAFLVAPTPERFSYLLFDLPHAPMLLYYPTQAAVLLILIPLSLVSADQRKGNATRLWFGMACGIGVAFLSIRHNLLWNTTLSDTCPELEKIRNWNCARRFDLLGHVVLGTMAFLAAGIFGELPDRLRNTARVALRHAMTAGILLLVALPGDVSAQDAGPAKTTVTIGFRKDAPPFSEERPDNRGRSSFKGYLADLCFDIFAGSDRYAVTAVGVDAQDRFKRLKRGGDRPGGELDMVCDAVTMRFSDPDRSKHAIYSPIVFAAGVSYLDRPVGGTGGVAIGYVRNTTASGVARKACHIDYFSSLLPFQKQHLLTERCNLRWRAAMLLERLEMQHSNGSWSAGGSGSDLWQDIARFREAGNLLLSTITDQQKSRIDLDTVRLLDLATTNGLNPADRASGPSLLATGCMSGATAMIRHGACIELAKALTDPLCVVPDPDRQDTPVLPARDVRPVEDRPWPEYHFCPSESHKDLIRWLCTSQGQRMIYMGDRELIAENYSRWVPDKTSCKVEQKDGGDVLSYEPYAFPIAMNDPELVQFIQRRIHELFSDRLAMNARFAQSFPERTMSVPLAYLFLLNAVEDDATVSAPPPEPEPSSPGG